MFHVKQHGRLADDVRHDSPRKHCKKPGVTTLKMFHVKQMVQGGAIN